MNKSEEMNLKNTHCHFRDFHRWVVIVILSILPISLSIDFLGALGAFTLSQGRSLSSWVCGCKDIFIYKSVKLSEVRSKLLDMPRQ